MVLIFEKFSNLDVKKRYYQESYEGTFYYFAGCMNVLCMHWAYELSYEPQSNNASSHLLFFACTYCTQGNCNTPINKLGLLIVPQNTDCKVF